MTKKSIRISLAEADQERVERVAVRRGLSVRAFAASVVAEAARQSEADPRDGLGLGTWVRVWLPGEEKGREWLPREEKKDPVKRTVTE